MTPVKVALVTPRFPPDIGGMEGYVGWVAETLQASGRFEVTVISTTAERRARQESYKGIPVHRLATWMTLSNTPVNPLWLRQVRRLLDRLDIDVVNAHAPVPGLADVAALTSRVPVVMTYHSGSLVKGSPVDTLLRAYERHVLPRVFDRCSELVAVSPVSMAHATGRAQVVPPGVDTALFTPPSGKHAKREPHVLYVGRVERTSRWKGLGTLVDSLPALRNAVPDARLDIVGDGDDVGALRARADQLGVGDMIDWHGRVDHRDLPSFYRRAGVTVLPSLTESESFGMTLVEAMATGCPVVGSRVGGIPFVVRDGVDGLLVTPGDPAALAGALAETLNDPERADQMGAAGREAAETRWDWERQREATLRVIEDAARKGTEKGTRKVTV